MRRKMRANKSSSSISIGKGMMILRRSGRTDKSFASTVINIAANLDAAAIPPLRFSLHFPVSFDLAAVPALRHNSLHVVGTARPRLARIVRTHLSGRDRAPHCHPVVVRPAEKLAPHKLISHERSLLPDHDEASLRARQRDVNSSPVARESDVTP